MDVDDLDASGQQLAHQMYREKIDRQERNKLLKSKRMEQVNPSVILEGSRTSARIKLRKERKS